MCMLLLWSRNCWFLHELRHHVAEVLYFFLKKKGKLMLNLLKSDQNIEKLAALFTELPQKFCFDFISENLVAAIIEKAKDGTSLIDFGSSFNVNFDWSIEKFWKPLRLVSLFTQVSTFRFFKPSPILKLAISKPSKVTILFNMSKVYGFSSASRSSLV